MARFKDVNWNVRTAEGDPGSAADCQEARLAVLMDIRDELKKLNRVFECRNFLRIPAKLDRIARNTDSSKKRRSRK